MKIFALGSTLVGSSAINLIACRLSNLVITDFPVHCGSLRNTKIHKQIHIQMHAQASEHLYTHVIEIISLRLCDCTSHLRALVHTYIWINTLLQTVSPRCCNQLHSAHASPFLIRSLVSTGLVTSCPPCQWHRHQPCHHQCHCHRFATIIVFFIIATLCF